MGLINATVFLSEENIDCALLLLHNIFLHLTEFPEGSTNAALVCFPARLGLSVLQVMSLHVGPSTFRGKTISNCKKKSELL